MDQNLKLLTHVKGSCNTKASLLVNRNLNNLDTLVFFFVCGQTHPPNPSQASYSMCMRASPHYSPPRRSGAPVIHSRVQSSHSHPQSSTLILVPPFGLLLLLLPTSDLQLLQLPQHPRCIQAWRLSGCCPDGDPTLSSPTLSPAKSWLPSPVSSNTPPWKPSPTRPTQGHSPPPR